MRDDASGGLLDVVPFQVIEIQNGVVLKRGPTEVIVNGEKAAEIIQIVTDALGKTKISKDQILAFFPATEQQAVSYLLDELIKRRLVIPFQQRDSVNNENELDVFNWLLGEQTQEIVKRLNSKNTVIIGMNHISLQLIRLLIRSGIENIQIVDYPILRSIDMGDASKWSEFPMSPVEFNLWEEATQPKDIDFLIATSDNGGLKLMRKWNEFCVKNDITFMPVVLQDLIGYIGPIVKPYETACFECFVSRRDSNLQQQQTVVDIEEISLQNHKVIGYHPAMPSILGDIAALELIKFHANWVQIYNVGKIIKVNMLSTELTTHKVLKVPRCVICSPLNRYPARSFTKLHFSSMQNV